jgi:hypothetical protein
LRCFGRLVFDTQVIFSAGDPRLRLKWVQRIAPARGHQVAGLSHIELTCRMTRILRYEPFGESLPSTRGVMTDAPSNAECVRPETAAALVEARYDLTVRSRMIT